MLAPPPYLLLIFVLSLLKKPERVRFMSPVGHFSPRREVSEGGRGAFARELGWELLGEEDADGGRPEGSEARVVRPRNGQKGSACMSATEGSLLLWAGGCYSGRDAHHREGSTKVKRKFFLLKKIHTVNIRRVPNNWSI